MDLDMEMQTATELQVDKLQAEKNVNNTNNTKNLEDAIYQATTVAGLLTSKGLILGLCMYPINYKDVTDNHCTKIQYLLKQIDTGAIRNYTDSTLTLGRNVRRAAALIQLKRILFNRTDSLNAAMLLGDLSAEEMHQCEEHGSRNWRKVPYAAVGIGKMTVMSIFKNSWKPNISKENGERLVFNAISAVNPTNSSEAGKIMIYNLE